VLRPWAFAVLLTRASYFRKPQTIEGPWAHCLRILLNVSLASLTGLTKTGCPLREDVKKPPLREVAFALLVERPTIPDCPPAIRQSRGKTGHRSGAVTKRIHPRPAVVKDLSNGTR